MDALEAQRRLTTLVAEKLRGAELVNWEAVEHSSRETAFVVRWRAKPDEAYGTHRAVLSNSHKDSMLVWGHYFNGTFSAPKSLRSYQARVAEYKEGG